MKLKQIEITGVVPQNLNTNQNNSNTNSFNIDMRRFPRYAQGDDVPAFLKSFERACSELEVPEQKWLPYIRSQISGALLEVYSAMRPSEIYDYSLFKTRVLHRFGITAESHRRNFRTLRKKHDESYSQVAAKLDMELDSWIKGSQVDSFEGLRNLVGLEQFFELVPSEVICQIKDKRPKTTEEAARLTDEYLAMMPVPQKRKQEGGTHSNQKNHKTSGSSEKNDKNSNFRKPFYKPAGNSQSAGSGKPKSPQMRPKNPNLQCWGCGALGHSRSTCTAHKPAAVLFTQEVQSQNPEVKQNMSAEPSTCLFIQTETDSAVGEMAVRSLPQKSKTQRLIELEKETPNDFMEEILVNNKKIKALRDSGSQLSIIRPDILPSQPKILPQKVSVRGLKSTIELPVAEISLNYRGVTANWPFALFQDLPVSCLIGNDILKFPKIETAAKQPLVDSEPKFKSSVVLVNSELQLNSTVNKLELPQENRHLFAKSQLEDTSLQTIWSQVNSQNVSDNNVNFQVIKGLLYRVSSRQLKDREVLQQQLVVPKEFRENILKMAHDAVIAGHLGIKKTKSRIVQNFYWPRVGQDVKAYCQSCDICQRRGIGGDKTKAKLCPIPVIDEPFRRIAMDIVGPFPPTQRNTKYILTVVDFATRFPEAVPLTNIETTTVANALISIWARTGFPQEIISDLGATFVSRLMKRLWEVCGIKHHTSTPYHPQSNGLVENFNGVLVRMIKSYVHKHHRDWDQKLQQFLFAYREVPQQSVGFSPFELLYGRQVRGPLTLLKENWEQASPSDPKDVVTYMEQFLNTMKENMDLAQQNLKTAQMKQKKWYDAKARDRVFKEGDEVLKLIPIKRDKLSLQWQGPFKVTRKLNSVNYLIETGEGSRITHVNMLKPYYRREPRVLYAVEEISDELPSIPHWSSTKPVLISPDFSKTFIVTTDASKVGLGAVLSQQGADQQIHPIMYLSKTCIARERNLSTIERECLAIVWALHKLRPYIWGRRFILQTDHSPLCWLERSKCGNAKLMRWSLLLQDYDYEIQHIRGKDNLVADGLSRKPPD